MAKTGRRRTLAQMDKDAQTLAYHLQAKSYTEIMALQGYKSKSGVTLAIKRAIADRQKDAFEQIEDFAVAIAGIQRLIAYHEGVMARTFYLTSTTGKLVYGPDGEPMIDPAPGQRSADAVRHLRIELAKLQGTYAPTRSKVDVVTDDVVQREIDQLAKEIAEAGKGTAVPKE